MSDPTDRTDPADFAAAIDSTTGGLRATLAAGRRVNVELPPNEAPNADVLIDRLAAAGLTAVPAGETDEGWQQYAVTPTPPHIQHTPELQRALDGERAEVRIVSESQRESRAELWVGVASSVSIRHLGSGPNATILLAACREQLAAHGLDIEVEGRGGRIFNARPRITESATQTKEYAP